MKECSSCGETKPLPQFPRSRNTIDGFGEVCKGCRDGYQTSGERQLRAAQQNHHFQKKRSEIYKLLGNMCACQGCEACGEGPCRSKEPPLHIDHVLWADKEFEVLQRQLSLQDPRMRSELKKTQLLCGPCHNVKTTKDRAEQRAAKDVLRKRNSEGWLAHERVKRGRRS